HGDDRFGERGDTEDGVARQGGVVDEGRRANGVDVHVVATGHEGDEPREATGGDMGCHRVVQAGQALPRQLPGGGLVRAHASTPGSYHVVGTSGQARTHR